jgi:hypothetical protein
MRNVTMLVAALSTACIALAAPVTQDSLTKLALPAGAGGPIGMPPAVICKSSYQGNHYELGNAKLDVTVSWFEAQLKGFSHVASANGGMHVFSDPAGSVVVIVLGTADGNVRSVAYELYRPGLSSKTLSGFTQNKMTC